MNEKAMELVKRQGIGERERCIVIVGLTKDRLTKWWKTQKATKAV